MQWLRQVKNIGVKYHAVRASVDSKDIPMRYISSAANRMDCVTNALMNYTFDIHPK